MSDGIDYGVETGERFGRFVYWLVKTYPPDKFNDESLMNMLRREFPNREATTGQRTFQTIRAYRNYAAKTPDRLGIQTDADAAAVMARLGGGTKAVLDLRIQQERERRIDLWRRLLEQDGPHRVAPGLLRQLGIYGGAQGIWVDKKKTKQVTDDGTGVTVGVLHTGSSYADDLSEDGVIYHYPSTKRQAGRDDAEVAATKAAGRLAIPVFVVHCPSPSSSKRNVELAWVEGWSDESRQFFLSFGESQPRLLDQDKCEEEPFVLTDSSSNSKTTTSKTRPNQKRFQFRVSQRYGMSCAVCGVDVTEVLDAAHIRPKLKRGTDDPRNGLILCSNHHRAFDANLFAFEPESLKVVCRESGPSAPELGIRFDSLSHVRRKPHVEALRWRWKQWKKHNHTDSE